MVDGILHLERAEETSMPYPDDVKDLEYLSGRFGRWGRRLWRAVRNWPVLRRFQ